MKKRFAAFGLIIAMGFAGEVGKLVVQSSFPRQKPISFDQALPLISKKVNATLPMQVDKDTRCDLTSAGPGNQFTYFYSLVNTARGNFDSNRFTNAKSRQLINLYWTSPDMVDFREHQTKLHYDFRDRNGRAVATINVGPTDSDCMVFEAIPDEEELATQPPATFR